MHRPSPRPGSAARPERGERVARPQLDGATEAGARSAALSRYVAAQIALRDGCRDRAVEACVERLLASDGRVALAELGALAGLGERQLQRRFAEVVGISPRMLAVVVRLRRVFEALRDAPWSSWSERAQAAGFFDHPQMARDFRRLLGSAPRSGRRAAAAWRPASPPASAEPSQSYKAQAPALAILGATSGRCPCHSVSPSCCRCSSCPPRHAPRRCPTCRGWPAMRRCKDGEIVEERWLGPRGELFIGANLTSNKGRASFENLRIARSDDTWTFWGSPMGRTPVPFRLIQSGAQRVVFANPEHAFRRASSTGATATICWRASKERSRTSRRRSSGASRKALRPIAPRRRDHVRNGHGSGGLIGRLATATTNSPGMR